MPKIITTREEMQQQLRDDIWAAKRRARMKLVEQCETTRIRKLIRAGDFSTIPEFEEYKDQFKDPVEKEESDYYFVTVNPQPNIELSELTKKVNKYSKRKIVNAAEWAYEQRSPDRITSGSGMHVHLIVKKQDGLRDLAFKQQTRATFADLCKNPERAIDIRIIKPEWVKDKRSYLQDTKTGDGKELKQAVDKIWRYENNLNDYYETINKLECPINLQPVLHGSPAVADLTCLLQEHTSKLETDQLE